jgi:Cu/Ag efflux pump CusA
MTIYNGLISTLVFNGNNISEDILSFGITAGGAMIDVSAVNLIGFQRIIGRRDAAIALTCRVSNAAAGAHATLKGSTAAAVLGACVITFTAGPVFTFTGIVGNYDVADGGDLGLVAQATISMSSGVAGAWT